MKTEIFSELFASLKTKRISQYFTKYFFEDPKGPLL